MSLPAAPLAAEVAQLAQALTRSAWPGAVPFGIHLEGPWISAHAAGAHPLAALREVDPREAQALLSSAGGLVRMVTLAPELPGAAALLTLLERHRIVAALGHSRASAAQIEAAIAGGLCHVTHLFNAMSPLHQRDRGVVGVALTEDRLTCDLICDGVHVHPALVRLAVQAKGERLLLITDRIDLPAEGSQASFGLGGLHEEGTVLRLADGRLAGSRVTLDRALRNVQEFAALSQHEAVCACTLRPARLLGEESKRGTLRPGAQADLVLLDAAARVRETWVAGRCVYRAPAVAVRD